jgi:hypothetical protein
MKLVSVTAMTIAFAAILLTMSGRAQQTGMHDHPMAQGNGMMDRDQMMTNMKAQDDRLEALAQKMKSAQGDEKIRAMQDLLTELVQSEVGMHRHMAMMHDGMMSQAPGK